MSLLCSLSPLYRPESQRSSHKLKACQACIKTIGGDQICVTAVLHNAPSVHHHDPVALAARAADSGGSAPATVTKEADLVVVTLKPEAEQSLRLKTASIEKRKVATTRLFSGEVVIPLATEGKTVAPVLGGTLDEVLRLADLQAAADGRILQAQVQIDAAKVALDRAQKMLSAEAGSVRSVDEAKAALSLAEAAITTAKAQRALLGGDIGQNPRRWVRVAIYSAEAALLDDKATAMHQTTALQPVAGPPTANATANTIDWYYALPADSKLRAGERIAIEIPAREHHARGRHRDRSHHRRRQFHSTE